MHGGFAAAESSVSGDSGTRYFRHASCLPGGHYEESSIGGSLSKRTLGMTVRSRIREFVDYRLILCVVYLITGLYVIAALPPGGGLDEPTHVARVAQISQGIIAPQRISNDASTLDVSYASPTRNDFDAYGGTTDKALYDLLVSGCHSLWGGGEKYSFPIWTDTRFIEHGSMGQDSVTWIFSNTAINSPAAYLPYIPAYLIATMLTVNPMFVLICLRLAGLLFLVCMLYLSLRMLPVGQITVSCIALLPVSVFSFVPVSADGPTFAYLCLYIAIIVRLVFTPDVRRSLYVLLAVASFGLCLSKMTYVVFGLLIPVVLLLCPRRRNMREIIWLGVIGVVSLLFFIVWYMGVKDINTGLMWKSAVNPSEQIQVVLSNPFHFLAIMGRTLLNIDCLGFSSGIPSGNAFTASWPVTIIVLFCILIDVTRGSSVLARVRQRLAFMCIVFAICILSAALICLGMYLQFTEVGLSVIDGVQTRYFMPLVLTSISSIVVMFSSTSQDGTEQTEKCYQMSRKVVFMPCVLALYTFLCIVIFLNI